MRRLTDSLTVQVMLVAPVELLVFTNHRVQYIMVTRLIFRRNQAVDLITSRLRVMSHMLIDTSVENSVHFLLAVQHVTPVIRVCAIQHYRLNM